MKNGIFLLLAIVVLNVQGQVYNNSGAKQAQKTNTDAFHWTGQVIVNGSSKVGSLEASVGPGEVSVNCEENVFPNEGKHRLYLLVTVGESSAVDSAVVEPDEIESLIKGADYLKNLDKSVTKLDSCTAKYVTRNGLVITRDGNFAYFWIGSMRCVLPPESLSKFNDLVKLGKKKLDEIRK